MEIFLCTTLAFVLPETSKTMKQFISSVAIVLSACLAHSAWAQAITGKGFIPDENGTNLDAPRLGKLSSGLTPGTVIKDCAECPEMVVLPAGSFLMGSPPDPEPDPFSNERPRVNGLPNEKPQHRVQMQSFAIGKYEVTQEQWYAVVGNNPSANKGRTFPVERVTWDEVQDFIVKLNQKTGQRYRLPSEAEWEYAARGGSSSTYPFGESDNELHVYAWFNAIANKTNPVGLKRPNQFGLFDMLGNVYEWTQDCWHDTYAGAPIDGSAWVASCTGNLRVLRGGSWAKPTALMRSATRATRIPDIRLSDFGFRLARDL